MKELYQKAEQGLKTRISGNPHATTEGTDLYTQRLKYELGVIKKNNFARHFLAVAEITRVASENQIPVGPGYGSTPGCLVNYALGISDIDPVQFGLHFERFIDSNRTPAYPCFSLNVSKNDRSKLIHLLQDRFGKDRVLVPTHSVRFDLFSALRHSAEQKKLETKKLRGIVNRLGDQEEFVQSYSTEELDELRDRYVADESILAVIDETKKLVGTEFGPVPHEIALIVSDTPVENTLPMESSSGLPSSDVTVELKQAYKQGLFVIDLVPSEALSILAKCLDNINRDRGVTIKFKEIPTDDEKTYDLIQSADTEDIYLLSNDVSRQLLQKVRPGSLIEISNLIALYRPGPLFSGMADKYIEHRNDPNCSVSPAALVPILKDTFGIILYQEQIMEIASQVAGFSLGEGDYLRKVLGKRRPDEVEEYRTRFFSGASKNGLPDNEIQQIFSLLAEYSNYCFNKSHAISCAFLTYWSAYLKVNFADDYYKVVNKIDDPK